MLRMRIISRWYACATRAYIVQIRSSMHSLQNVMLIDIQLESNSHFDLFDCNAIFEGWSLQTLNNFNQTDDPNDINFRHVQLRWLIKFFVQITPTYRKVNKG